MNNYESLMKESKYHYHERKPSEILIGMLVELNTVNALSNSETVLLMEIRETILHNIKILIKDNSKIISAEF